MPENWICPSCNAYNPPRRVRCWRCRAFFPGADVEILKARRRIAVNRAVKVVIGILTSVLVCADLSLAFFWTAMMSGNTAAVSFAMSVAWPSLSFIISAQYWLLPLRVVLKGFYLFHVVGNAQMSVVRRATLGAAFLCLPFVSLPIYFLRAIWPGAAFLPAAPSQWTLPVVAQKFWIFKWPVRLAVLFSAAFRLGYAVFTAISSLGNAFEIFVFQDAQGMARGLLNAALPFVIASILALICQAILIWFSFLYLLETPKTSRLGCVMMGLILAYFQSAALLVSMNIILARSYRKLGILAADENAPDEPVGIDPMLSRFVKYLSARRPWLPYPWSEQKAVAKFFAEDDHEPPAALPDDESAENNDSEGN